MVKEKLMCAKCHKLGYKKVRTIKGHKYVYFRHITECYIGREDEYHEVSEEPSAESIKKIMNTFD